MFSFAQCIKFYVQNRLVLGNVRSFKQLVDVLPEVSYALKYKQPVVALESTIITHGMPYPQNLQTAREVEDLVRENGATPATIAILDGRIKVGLTAQALSELAQKPLTAVSKCSRRDLAYILAKKQSGGTTVAATMLISHMVGVPIFATGGIGGVHREGHVSLDVSADLVELGRTPVAVVCSGIKSILDIPRTLEYLETQGVCTLTYGSEDGNFPDFYTRESGCKVPYNVNTPQEAAQLIKAAHALKLQSGLLIAVPIPQQFEADKTLINKAIRTAHAEAQAQGITGKEVTPFLLAAIAKITSGSSLQSNIALIKNNATIAAQIAKNLSQTTAVANKTNVPLVIGASIMDLALTITEDIPDVLNGATYNTQAKQSAGGVGRNLAEGIYKLYGAVNFLSVVGADQLGQSLLHLMPKSLQQNIEVTAKHATSLCSVIFDKVGDCKLILGNMEIHNCITPQMLQKQIDLLLQAPLIIMDGNLGIPTMQKTLELAREYEKPVFFEPTDMRIAHKPFTLAAHLCKQIKLISPNVYELKAIVEALTGQSVNWQPNVKLSTSSLMQEVKPLLLAIQAHFDCILVTLGHHGVWLSIRGEPEQQFSLSGKDVTAAHTLQFYVAPKVRDLTNVSGAGDSFSSGFITGLLRNYDIERAVALGFIAAERALKSSSAVPTVYFNDGVEQSEELTRQLQKLRRRTI